MAKASYVTADILDHLLEGYQIIDPEWRYVYMNDVAVQQSKQSKQALLGRTMMECYPGIEKTEMFDHLRRCMEEKTPGRMENFFTYPNGQTRWFDLRMERIPEGVLVFSIDITERKVTEERVKKQRELLARKNQELAKFKLAVDGASDMIIIADPDGTILHANESYRKLTGYTARETLGKNALAMWAAAMPGTFYAHLQQVLCTNHKPFEGDIRKLRRSGEAYDSHLTVTPVYGSGQKILFFIGIEHDVSREKAVDRAKTEFVYLASHQLRTPTSIIRWSLESLAAEKLGKSPLGKEVIGQIGQANGRMIRLVDTMLHIARMEAGKTIVKTADVNVGAVAKREIAALRLHIRHKKIHLSLKAAKHTTIKTDQDFLQIIIQNLVGNAVKYTPEGGSVDMHIATDAHKLTITIADTGCGIPKKQQSHVFEKMFRADNVRMFDAEGTGLGLYLVKMLVRYLNGSIGFTSKENVGTTFKVTLPLAQPKAKTAALKA